MGCCLGTLANQQRPPNYIFTRSGVENPENVDNHGSVYRSIVSVYPEQPDHLQAVATRKYWDGGKDPIDFVSVLKHPGDASQSIPPHWHYVSYGLSDIYGDGRVHGYRGPGMPSGFGFELTMRVRCMDEEEVGDEEWPPLWPVYLMNSLSKYVFKTGGVLKIGDHVMWNAPIDGKRQTRLQHLLVAEDPALRPANTANGNVEFRQIVGVMEAEMKAARQWSGKGVLDLLASQAWAAGSFYVTNVLREHSIFHVDPSLREKLEEGIGQDGSNLGNVRAACTWYMDDASRPATVMQRDEEMGEEIMIPTSQLNSVHLMFEIQASEYLPLVVRGRLQKGRSFFFVTADDQLITLIPPEFRDEAVAVDAYRPLQTIGKALQIYCSHATIAEMAELISQVKNLREHELPKELQLSTLPLTITIVDDEDIVELDKLK